MRFLTEFIVRVADLAEAEGRALRAAMARLALGVAFIVIAIGAISAGMLLLLGAIYIVTANRAGPAVGVTVVGVIALAAGGLLAWMGHRMGSR